MPVSPHYRMVDIEPLTGILDTRSPAKEMPFGAWRRRQNYEVTAEGKLVRSPGWRKMLADVAPYNNQDLHDQLCGDPVGTTNLQQYYEEVTPPYAPQSDITAYPPLSTRCGTVLKTRATGRQPVTLLQEITASTGIRKLVAATQNRIYCLNETKGNWKIIADKYGGTPKAGLPERRWKCAISGDAIVFTNNFDPVLAWSIGQPTTGCDMQSAQPITELADIGLSKAAVVVSWKGVIFLMDVEMDGARFESRVVWSDLNKPYSFVPGAASIAGFQDLTYGERILNAMPLGDALLIYTNRSIWQVTVVGGDVVFNFRSLYSEPAKGAGCLAFRNTLVSTGDTHLYAGLDGIYVFNPYMARPQLEEWIHRGTFSAFEELHLGVCEAHIGHYDTLKDVYSLSYVAKGKTFPETTFQLNLRYKGAWTLDHGFTAICNFTSDRRPSIRDWLLSKCICTTAELAAQTGMQTDVKEGGYCSSPAALDCSAVDRKLPMWTRAVRMVDGKEVEDWSRPKPDADSLCGLLAGATLEDLCQECNADRMLVGASTADWCLKQLGGVYSRERCTVFTGCGTYTKDGYDSVLTSGPFDYNKASEDKNVRKVELDAEPEQQTVPSSLFLKVGYSAAAIDPLKASGHCAIVWREQEPRELKCMSLSSEAQHKTLGTRPNRVMEWNVWYTGRFIYYELRITGLGGACQLSRLGADLRLVPRTVTA